MESACHSYWFVIDQSSNVDHTSHLRISWIYFVVEQTYRHNGWEEGVEFRFWNALSHISNCKNDSPIYVMSYPMNITGHCSCHTVNIGQKIWFQVLSLRHIWNLNPYSSKEFGKCCRYAIGSFMRLISQ